MNKFIKLKSLDESIDNLLKRYPEDKDIVRVIDALQAARTVKVDNYDDDIDLVRQLENAAIEADSSLIELAYLRINTLIRSLTEEKLRSYKEEPEVEE